MSMFQPLQSRFFWLLRYRLGPVTKRSLPFVERLFRSDERRILVQMTETGFTATLARPKGSPIAAHWQSDEARWTDDEAFNHLARRAREMAVELVLPQTLVLSQSVVLPRAALINVADAIVYGFPSWSPFTAGELYLRPSIRGIDRGQVTFVLTYARKAKVDPLIAELQAVGLAPDRVTMAPAPGNTIALSTQKFRRMRRARRIDVALYLGALAATAFLCVVRTSDLSQRLADADTALRAELFSYRQEETLRSGVDRLLEARLTVSRRRAAEPSASEVLAAVAKHLPEDVTLHEVALSRSRGSLDITAHDGGKVLEALRPVALLHQLTIESAGRGGHVRIAFRIASRKP